MCAESMTTKALSVKLKSCELLARWRCYVALAEPLSQCDGHNGTEKEFRVIITERRFSVMDE